MTKADLVAEIAKGGDLTKVAAEKALNAFIDAAKKALGQEGKIVLPGFGAFVVTETKARTGRNPKTGEAIQIKAGKVVRFRAGKALKDSL
jgi:DNA-binding protein HU-beta